MNGETNTIAELNAARRPTPPRAAPAGALAAARPVPPYLLRLAGPGKDGLDWAMDLFLIGEIPVLGQVPGILLTLFIAAYALRQGGVKRGGARLAVAGLLMAADNLPLINNLPLMSIATFLL